MSGKDIKRQTTGVLHQALQPSWKRGHIDKKVGLNEGSLREAAHDWCRQCALWKQTRERGGVMRENLGEKI